MKKCSVEGCVRKYDSSGYCGTHRWQLRNWGFTKTDIEPRYKSPTGMCEVAECAGIHVSGGLCSKHFAQKNYYGGIRRTVHDRNEIKIVGDVAEISLYDSKLNTIAKALIDAEDVDRVRGFKWHLSGNHVRSQRAGIHNVIMGRNLIDHINGDPLDNRKANLRFATAQQNSFNSSGWKKKTTSIYKGVHSCNMTRKPWRAVIKIDDRFLHIGRFFSEKEAAWMYDQYAIQLHGDFARTNFDYHRISLPDKTLSL